MASADHYEMLTHAVLNQDWEKLDHLMLKIPEGKRKTMLANQLLVQALDKENRRTIEKLLAHGAEINAHIDVVDFGPFDLSGLTPLELAIIRRKMVALSVLIGLGADVNLADHDGQTPLHLACSTVYFPVEGVRKLLEAGADCNKGCLQTPLQAASAIGRPDVVKLLLEHGADVHQTDADGNTCVALALKSKMHVAAASGSLPARLFSTTPTSDIVRKGKISCAKILLDAGSDINVVNNQGASILYSIINTNLADKDLLSYLLSRGANPDVGHICSGVTPIMSVARSPLKLKREELMHVLLEHGAIINKADMNGNTALHYAATNADPKAITFLLDNGADAYALNDKKASFMDTLSHDMYLDFLPTLLGKGVYPCRIAVQRGTNFDSFITQCESHLPPTPLSLAMFFGYTELAMRLKDLGFLTGEDVRWLAGESRIRAKLSPHAVQTYDNLITGVCSLTLMSFVRISDLLGATSDRASKVKQLRLPTFLQERLLFKRVSPLGQSSVL
ncbi:hypothetical protein EGW08_021275 [Elysia chlorotica]|uniref:Uncharacterized protein n=1 Tax=Elysia chlorotica TaxID=188477 RepID=A0A3S1ASL7_ELYCH|nr:hypothetical protein EGW08_021275 [Elysia chlorotica]